MHLACLGGLGLYQQFELLDWSGLGKPLTAILLIFHDAAAVMLLCFITYQALMVTGASASQSLALPSISKRRDVSGLAPVIAGLVVVTVILGGSLYPAYRMTVRPFLETHSLKEINGVFEIKEHFAALALLSTPAYLAAWRSAKDPKHWLPRRALTYILGAIVWWNFLVGHVLHHIKALP